MYGTNPGPGHSDFMFDDENDGLLFVRWTALRPLEWGIYVTGSARRKVDSENGLGVEDLQGDVKFCELVGSTLKNLLLVNQLERRQASLRSFFSPVVLNALAEHDPDAVFARNGMQSLGLILRFTRVCQTSELMADEIFRLLDRVSQSLDIMTGKILEHSGVIGDFQGDSAMGFGAGRS